MISRDRGIELMQEWEDTRCGPPTCKEFEEANPGGCDNCAFRGRITSPIVLGRGYENAGREDQQTGEAAAILNADLWSMRPDLAPPAIGSAFIELLNPYYPVGAHVQIPEFLRPRLLREDKIIRCWAQDILSAAASVNCYIEAEGDNWLIVGKTRLPEPHVLIHKGMRDKFDHNSVDPNTGYKIHAPTMCDIVMSGRGSGNPSACIDPVLLWAAKYQDAKNYQRAKDYHRAPPPSVNGQSSIAEKARANIDGPFDETPEDIARFCTALTFVDPSNYHGSNYPGIDPTLCLGWFEGMCAIASLPWRQEVKERIAIWWSKRTTRGNYAGNEGVLRKLNHDIGEKAGGITYRSVFKLAYARGWDGREN